MVVASYYNRNEGKSHPVTPYVNDLQNHHHDELTSASCVTFYQTIYATHQLADSHIYMRFIDAHHPFSVPTNKLI